MGFRKGGVNKISDLYSQNKKKVCSSTLLSLVQLLSWQTQRSDQDSTDVFSTEKSNLEPKMLIRTCLLLLLWAVNAVHMLCISFNAVTRH